MTYADAKGSIAAIATTLGVNLAWIIDLIPDNIGKLSAFLCVIACLYVIRHHRQTIVKNEQEIEINKLEIAERVIRINALKNGEEHD